LVLAEYLARFDVLMPSQIHSFNTIPFINENTMQSFLVYSSALLGFAGLSIAQTFSDLPLGLAYPKISTTCAQALNTTVSCPGFLGIVSSEYATSFGEVDQKLS
jgi:hypothetical protein